MARAVAVLVAMVSARGFCCVAAWTYLGFRHAASRGVPAAHGGAMAVGMSITVAVTNTRHML
jgi:hypothetical protein